MWAEVSPGLYRRPLGETEKGMVAAIAAERPFPREFVKIHSFVEITSQSSTDETIKALRLAWRALRLLKSPDIATMFKDGYNEYRVPSSEDDIVNWLTQTFVVADAGTSTEAVVKTMQQRLEYMPVCYIVPQHTQDKSFRGTIIFFLSHWRSEASGVYQMIGQLCDYASDLLRGKATLDALADHVLGSETHLLVPALEDVTMPNRESSDAAKARAAAHYKHYYAHLPSVGIALKADPATPHSEVLLDRRVYDEEATTSLVTACKIAGFTVTAALHSAYIGVIYSLLDSRDQKKSYASLMPAQVRPRLPLSSPYREQGCWAASQMLMLVVPAGLNFEARAQSLRQQYSLASQDQWWFEDCRAMISEMNYMPSNPSTEVPTDTAMPYFTSLGVLDRGMLAQEHGDITVENAWGWADPMGPGCVLTMWTFRSRLNIQITWNASFHGREQIAKILDTVDEILKKELDADINAPTSIKATY